MSVILCGPRDGCRDPNINRWYCLMERDGSCPVNRCAERASSTTGVDKGAVSSTAGVDNASAARALRGDSE